MSKRRFLTGNTPSERTARPTVQGPFLSQTFKALLKEAEFTKEMLGSGATQIRKANYASKGLYFEAFTSLSTGLERIGKLCLMLGYYIDHNRQFPDSDYLKNKIGHNLKLIYRQSKTIMTKYSMPMEFLQNLDDPIHQAILSVLSEFALGDRYSNIDLLVGGTRQNDPVASWFKNVDQPLYQNRVGQKKRDKIRGSAAIVGSVLGQFALVLHTSEAGDEINDVEEASYMTGVWQAVAPHRQLCVLQIIRYWVELLRFLQFKAMALGGEDIPHFGEIFALFNNEDSYIKTRKAWDKL